MGFTQEGWFLQKTGLMSHLPHLPEFFHVSFGWPQKEGTPCLEIYCRTQKNSGKCGKCGKAYYKINDLRVPDYFLIW